MFLDKNRFWTWSLWKTFWLKTGEIIFSLSIFIGLCRLSCHSNKVYYDFYSVLLS